MTVAQLTCKKCSAAIEQGDRFCWDCGEKLISRGVRVNQLRDDNPLIKAEIVFVIALLTFGVSAIAWNFSTGTRRGGPPRPPAKSQKSAIAIAPTPITRAPSTPVPITPMPITPARAPESELDRLWQQASNAPVTTPTPVMKPVLEKPKPRVIAPAVAPIPQPKRPVAVVPTKPKNTHITDVAEYNKKLEAYFSAHPPATKDGAAGDIQMGSDPQPSTSAAPAPEPPSYDEWLKSGKPEF